MKFQQLVLDIRKLIEVEKSFINLASVPQVDADQSRDSESIVDVLSQQHRDPSSTSQQHQDDDNRSHSSASVASTQQSPPGNVAHPAIHNDDHPQGPAASPVDQQMSVEQDEDEQDEDEQDEDEQDEDEQDEDEQDEDEQDDVLEFDQHTITSVTAELIRDITSDNRAFHSMCGYPLLRAFAFNIELHQELILLELLLTRSDSLESLQHHFRDACRRRESATLDGAMSFFSAPNTRTNRLYWLIARLLFEPKTLPELLEILLPGLTHSLVCDARRVTPTRQHEAPLFEVFVRETEGVEVCAEVESSFAIANLRRFIRYKRALFDLHQLQKLPLKELSEVLESLKTFPNLAEQLATRTAQLGNAFADAAIYRQSTITLGSALRDLVNALAAGGVRVFGNEESEPDAKFTMSLSRFSRFLQQFSDTQRQEMMSLKTNCGTLGGALQPLETHLAVRCTDLSSTRLLSVFDYPENQKLLNVHPLFPKDLIADLEKRYGRESLNVDDVAGALPLPEQLCEFILKQFWLRNSSNYLTLIRILPLSMLATYLRYMHTGLGLPDDLANQIKFSNFPADHLHAFCQALLLNANRFHHVALLRFLLHVCADCPAMLLPEGFVSLFQKFCDQAREEYFSDTLLPYYRAVSAENRLGLALRLPQFAQNADGADIDLWLNNLILIAGADNSKAVTTHLSSSLSKRFNDPTFRRLVAAPFPKLKNLFSDAVRSELLQQESLPQLKNYRLVMLNSNWHLQPTQLADLIVQKINQCDAGDRAEIVTTYLEALATTKGCMPHEKLRAALLNLLPQQTRLGYLVKADYHNVPLLRHLSGDLQALAKLASELDVSGRRELLSMHMSTSAHATFLMFDDESLRSKMGNFELGDLLFVLRGKVDNGQQSVSDVIAQHGFRHFRQIATLAVATSDYERHAYVFWEFASDFPVVFSCAADFNDLFSPVWVAASKFDRAMSSIDLRGGKPIVLELAKLLRTLNRTAVAERAMMFFQRLLSNSQIIEEEKAIEFIALATPSTLIERVVKKLTIKNWDNRLSNAVSQAATVNLDVCMTLAMSLPPDRRAQALISILTRAVQNADYKAVVALWEFAGKTNRNLEDALPLAQFKNNLKERRGDREQCRKFLSLLNVRWLYTFLKSNPDLATELCSTMLNLPVTCEWEAMAFALADTSISLMRASIVNCDMQYPAWGLVRMSRSRTQPLQPLYGRFIDTHGSLPNSILRVFNNFNHPYGGLFNWRSWVWRTWLDAAFVADGLKFYALLQNKPFAEWKNEFENEFRRITTQYARQFSQEVLPENYSYLRRLAYGYSLLLEANPEKIVSHNSNVSMQH